MNCKLSALILLLFTTSCANDKENFLFIVKPVDEINININDVKDYQDFSQLLDASIIQIPVNDFTKVLQVFSMGNGNVLTSERDIGRIRHLDASGKISWELTPGEGPGKYPKYTSISVDTAKQQVYVNDDFYQYRYDKNGVFIDRISPGFNYTECFIADSTNKWYVSNVFNSSHLFPEKEISYELYHKSYDNLIGFIPFPKMNKPTNYVDYSDLFYYKSDLFYHRSFSDTIYTVDVNLGKVSPILTISYENFPPLSSLKRNTSKLHRYVYENDLPFTKFCIPTAINKSGLIIYNNGRELALAQYQPAGEIKKNAKKILIDEVLYDIPYLQANGTFSYISFDYEQEHLQRLLTEKDLTFAQWKLQLEQLQIEKGDNGTAVLVMITPK